jgi:hypothetical protein
MNLLRLATEAEVETIKENSDLDPTCVILALTTQVGSPLAVRRVSCEIDPMHFPAQMNFRQRFMFIRDIENMLWGQGIERYYFNINAEDEEWRTVVKNWGAEEVSEKPVIRYKRTLVEHGDKQ